MMLKAQLLSAPVAESNLRDRVLGEVEKINFIALPVTGGHSRLLPSKLCPNLEGLVSFIEMVQRGCDQLEDILLIGW